MEEKKELLQTSVLQPKGGGTKDNPYIISDTDTFLSIHDNLSAFYRLEKDINFGGATLTPIGTQSLPFTGGFDGAGHTIKNLVIDEKGYAGLFGYIKMADLRGLMLESVQVTSTNNYAGALAGCMQGGSVSECCAEGTVKGYTRVGGLIGYACQNAVIDDSYARGSVMDSSSYVHAGGLVGYAENIGIRNSYASCMVDKSSSAYGLAYVYSSTTVENSYYDIQVTGYKSNMYNVGKLTVALTNKNFLKAWDFENVWEIEEGKTYPYLKSMGRMAGGEIDLGYIKGGAGTEEDPYQIQDANGLSMVQNDLAGWYRLLADIDFAGEMLTPIGTQLLPFTGGFDGFGHSIRNFCIDAVGYAGLFGYTSMADLRGLMLEGVQVKVIGISNYAGALAGYMEEGRVSRCCAEGIIEGAKCVGGLIGYAGKNSVISDSYARGSVTGIETSGYVGGLIGLTSQSDIRNSYAACEVSKNTSTCGLSGITTYATVDNSYYDSQITGYMNDMYNIGKLTVALTKKIVFKLWDFESIWDIQEGRTYPYLKCMGRIAGGEIELKVITEGAGIEESPYRIKDANGLSMVQNDLAGWYRLTEDINLNSAVHISIGTQSVPFSGGFDGAGHSIRNFIISRDSYAGFFGYTTGAALKNLMLEEAQVEATGNHAGILAGYMRGGSVNRCCAEGSVAGNSYVGGLVGRAYLETDISDSYGRGRVKATERYAYAGGLVGYAEKIVIRNCYAACTVSGNGGFGLANVSSATIVEDSYFDSQVAGYKSNAYNVGKLTAGLMSKNFLKNWDFEEIWTIVAGETYPYLKCMGKLAGGSIDPGFITDGAGTEENPYWVKDLGGLSLIPKELAGQYCLAADIDLDGAAITPIGTESLPFTGGFNGNGHTISNYVLSTSSYAGLFGYAREAELRDLILKKAEVISTGSYTGALAAYMENCTVRNISQSEITVTGGSYTGALSGYARKGSIIGCCARKNILVTGTSGVGGLVGTVTDSSTILKECCTTANVTGSTYVGGIAGLLECSIVNSYATGSVISATDNLYTGGLAGCIRYESINSCYAACSVSKNGSGLANLFSATVTNSFFDSNLAGLTTPTEQARTTDQMLTVGTYIGWDWENVWDYKENHYPNLRNIEFIMQEPFELAVNMLTHFSVVIEWPVIPDAKNYQISYLNIEENVTASRVLIEDLVPETEYEFRVCAQISDVTRIWSKKLRVKTKKIMSVLGLHSIGKGPDFITLVWDPAEHAETYEVTYNGCIQSVKTNECTLTGLNTGIPYMIRVKALISDGSSIISDPIMEKIYRLDPQTEYAKEFINKCEGQTWFMDEIENLLNLKGKSINTIQSREDFTSIFAIGLANRGIGGMIPAAIGELYRLEYLFLANNKLNGKVPDELSLLKHLAEADFTGNQIQI